MSDKKKEELIKKANSVIEEETEQPVSVEEFVDMLLEDPNIGRCAHKYLLDAIEYFGQRTVFEQGEEKQRYIFFDDPSNNGKNAVLGNTDTLNSFVEDIRVIVNSDQRMQKIMLFSGPTATGKSELKRCIINGLRAYSSTDEGRRYTCEWNHAQSNSSYEMTYGDMSSESMTERSEWRISPVQINPISVLPKQIRQEISEQFKDKKIITDINLDPFSQKEYDIIKKQYENSTTENLFSSTISKNNIRVRRYAMRRTQGIGVLTSEDDGSIKERLLGGWMPNMLRELDSFGEKDPRAFSYDGVISQGNSGVTIVEDATKHVDILMHLLNIPDEGHAKIDKEIGFDVDTVPIFISNPEIFSEHLSKMKKEEIPMKNIHGSDPLKAIKRRIQQYDFNYLTSLSDEAELLRKEVSGFTDYIKSGKSDPRDGMTINGTEFSPRTLEAAALYNVVTRMSKENLKDELNLVDMALLYDKGYIETDEGRKNIDEFEIQDDSVEGTFGIPVTYTRDLMRSLLHSNDSTDIYLPTDIVEKMQESLNSEHLFSEKEVKVYKKRVKCVKEYINEKQQDEVIESILFERKASQKAVNEYVDNLYEWQDGNEDEYDPYLLKDFENKHLGTTKSEYDGQEPNEDVIKMRRERIIFPLNRYNWKERSEEFEASDLKLKDVPVLSSILGEYSWTDVFSAHPNLDVLEWEEPSQNTETNNIKEKCIDNMVSEYGYSEESAKKTANRVFERNRDDLQDIKQSVVD